MPEELHVKVVGQRPAILSKTVKIAGVGRGAKGDDGLSNVLTIGTVTTGAPGSEASATLTGTSPAQVLNLTIPKGADGDEASVTLETVGTVLHGAGVETTVADGDEFHFWQAAGNILRRISDSNLIVWIKSKLGYGDIVTHNVSEFATSAQGSTADTAVQPGDLPDFGDIVTHDVSEYATSAKFVAGEGALTGPASPLTIGTAAASAVGDFDASGAAAAALAIAINKPLMLVTGTLYAGPGQTNERTFGRLLYDGAVNSKVSYESADADTAIWDGAQWVLAHHIDGAWYSSDPVASPDLATTWTPELGGDGTPTVTAASLDDLQPLADALTTPQLAATPSIRALGTGATEAMPGNTAVVLDDAAYANRKSLSLLASTY